MGFPALESYCSDIPEGKDMSAVLKGISISRPCLCSLFPVVDIRPLQCGEALSLAETQETKEYSRAKKIKAAVQIAEINRDAHRVFWTVGSRC